ncbi:hypothetical protein E2C01_013599 [Portunus trituberculatus]|uniref:Uncharacterized protein n=1 Tax=Portunus trituberculatus TaxID=210409 RepID=A0A5B7DHT1_PORTR|nr:hypothetical protein [Portunus trituberculatus]
MQPPSFALRARQLSPSLPRCEPFPPLTLAFMPAVERARTIKEPSCANEKSSKHGIGAVVSRRSSSPVFNSQITSRMGAEDIEEIAAFQEWAGGGDGRRFAGLLNNFLRSNEVCIA